MVWLKYKKKGEGSLGLFFSYLLNLFIIKFIAVDKFVFN